MKNKREIWKAETSLRKYRGQARELLARIDSNDYVSMEMIVYLNTETGDIEYEPEFQNAAI